MIRFPRNKYGQGAGQKPDAPINRLARHLSLVTLSLVTLFSMSPLGSYVAAEPLTIHPVMRFTAEERKQQNEMALNAPLAVIDEEIRKFIETKLDGSALNLLSRISYVPQERDQGLNGSCWVWTSTGIMEIALNVQSGVGVKERLSIQYLMSNYNGGSGPNWAGNGGNATAFANFYNAKKMVIPWSNLNANYQDQNSTSGTRVPASSISTTPNYALTYVGASRIPTYGISNESAILNIKTILNQNKGIYFGFYLANATDWTQFNSFWNTQPESALWSGGYSAGKVWDDATGGGHSVLCVGYNDSDPDPSKHYWIMLNSWGATSERPNGLFRIPVEYNYSVADSTGDYTTAWWTITPTYAAVVPMIPKQASLPSSPSTFTNPKDPSPCIW